MSISCSCLPEPGKCPGKPLIALPDRLCGPIYRHLIYHLNQRKYIFIEGSEFRCPEGTAVVIIGGMNFCNFKSCPLESPRYPIWRLISKPYLHSEIANDLLIYGGHNSQNGPIPFLVYGKQTSIFTMRVDLVALLLSAKVTKLYN